MSKLRIRKDPAATHPGARWRVEIAADKPGRGVATVSPSWVDAMIAARNVLIEADEFMAGRYKVQS